MTVITIVSNCPTFNKLCDRYGCGRVGSHILFRTQDHIRQRVCCVSHPHLCFGIVSEQRLRLRLLFLSYFWKNCTSKKRKQTKSTMATHKNLCPPAFVEIPGGLRTGHQITIVGKVTCDQFSINFQRNKLECSDIAFHFNPRENEGTVVRNTFLNGCWQHEERDDLCSFPFNVGQEFRMHVTVTCAGYEVCVNCNDLLTYAHRINHEEMCYLELSAGAEYHVVEIHAA